MARIRSRQYGSISGTAVWYSPGPVTVNRTSITRRSTISDSGIAGDRDNALDISHTFSTNPTVNKSRSQLPYQYYAKNFPLTYFATGNAIAHLADPNRPSNPVLAVSVVAKTNPSSAVVDLPVSIVELRELPDLLRKTGEGIIKKIAGNNLKYQFGLVPLYSDLRKLMNFRRDVENRIKLFKKFAAEGTMLRKVRLYSSTVSSELGNTVTTNSSPSWATLNHVLVRHTTKRTVWGYVRWTPTADFSKIAGNKDALQRAAINAAYGLKIDYVTAWNLFPWSWLADWFSNIGDWLESHRRVVPIIPGIPRICETTVSVYHFRNLAQSNLALEPGTHCPTLQTIRKTRNAASASLPSAYLPLLTGRQIGILSSLFVLRAK